MFSFLSDSIKLFPKPMLIRSIEKLPAGLKKLEQSVTNFIELFQQSLDGVYFEVPLDNYKKALHQIDTNITNMYSCFASVKTHKLENYSFADQDKIRKACYQARESVNEQFRRAKNAEQIFFIKETVKLPPNLKPELIRSELPDLERTKNNFINHIQRFNGACGALNTSPEEKSSHTALLSSGISSEDFGDIELGERPRRT